MPTFDTPNSTQTYTLPTDATVEVFGAGGGRSVADNNEEEGGNGGYASIEVESGTTLEIAVGEGGSAPAGGRSPAGDGGNGGESIYASGADGGGGGGATTVTRQSDGVELVAAGGGGGGGGRGAEYSGGGGGARGGLGGGAVDNPGQDAAGSGVGGNGGQGEFGRNGGQEPGEPGGVTTAGGVTVNDTQTGGGNGGDAEVVVTLQVTQPTGVQASYVADDEVQLSFDSQDAADSFDVEIRRDDGSWVSPAGGPSSPSSGGTYSYGPNSDSPYGEQVGIDSGFEFRVRATNSISTSDWAYSGTVYTTPIPPHNPSVSRPDADTLRIESTVKSDIAEYFRLEYRVDTGGGYGSWEWIGTTVSGESQIVSGDPATQGSELVVEYTVGGSTQSGDELQEDARHQFRAQSSGPGMPKSEYVYADYGNEGNVYFEDDFESGDLSAWDATNLVGDTGVQSGSGPADLTVSGADQGTNYFYGEGANGDQGTWIQKNLGDLSGEVDVLVRCAFATASLDSNQEDFGISWYDGSSWHALRHYKWEYNKQGWFEVSVIVDSSWLSSDNRIRVGTATSSGMYGGDHFAVDRVVVSDILHEYTSPAAPSSISLDTSVQREAAGSWSLNASFTDGVQTHFGQAGSTLSTTDHPVGTTSDDYTGLLDGERYRLEANEVVEQDRRGAVSTVWGGSRAAVEATTILPAPTGFDVSNVTDSTADYAWQSTHNNGNVLVQYKPTSASSWNTFTTTDRTEAAMTVTGLLHGEAYDARVVANTDHAQTEDDS
ncbi:hypothetical protein DJ68_17300 [Halorubrum sp. C3]|nr:hypothetical protein DJ68_17300 [Halorubrum sp. C3]